VRIYKSSDCPGTTAFISSCVRSDAATNSKYRYNFLRLIPAAQVDLVTGLLTNCSEEVHCAIFRPELHSVIQSLSDSIYIFNWKILIAEHSAVRVHVILSEVCFVGGEYYANGDQNWMTTCDREPGSECAVVSARLGLYTLECRQSLREVPHRNAIQCK
jgi:hypothetical protein